MDLAGWVQVLSIGVLTITLLTALWKIARMYAKIETKADKANERIDKFEDSKGFCSMGEQIKEKVEDHERRIRTIEDSSARTEEHVIQIKEDLNQINVKIDKLLEAGK